MPNIQDIQDIVRAMRASPRVSMLVDDGLIELSGSPDVNICDMDIRITGHRECPEVEIHNLETEVELADVEITVDYNYVNRIMVHEDDLSELIDRLEDLGKQTGTLQARLDAAEEKATELRAMMFSLKHTLDIFLS